VAGGSGLGEDYELLFTVAEGVEVPARCAATGTKITRIGRVEAGAGVYLHVEGEMRGIEGAGWEHGGQ
jgi:thiamine monophosphate kinase